MIIWGGGAWHEGVAVDERCVNEGAKRGDGTFCKERAEANGWCEACWAGIAPRSVAAQATGV